MNVRTRLHQARRFVFKVGSALVTNNGLGLDEAALGNWAQQVQALQRSGKQIILVSSGSIAAGMRQLNWAQRPKEMPKLQAAAALGQMRLAQAYEEAFARYQCHCAQILLTHDDLADRKRYLNARSTLRTLLDLNIVPIINENDTIATDEIRFGDNDTLGALVANLIEADALVILTDQNGLYTKDPRRNSDATLITEDMAENTALDTMAGGAASQISTGGMLTKVRAAHRAARSGAHTVIANGHQPDVLLRICNGEPLGTLLYSSSTRMQARKQWLADHLQLTGRLQLDAGACKALLSGKSLLPVGVTLITGEFERGAVVACLDPSQREIARGLINYSSQDCRRIAQQPSHRIDQILGFINTPELIHRDNLVVLTSS